MVNVKSWIRGLHTDIYKCGGEVIMKRRKLIFSSALYIGIFALCFLMLDVKCTLEKPSAPSWDVQFIIPLIDKKYTMEK